MGFYVSAFILSVITDQPILIIGFHVLFFLVTGFLNYFEAFFGAATATICLYQEPNPFTTEGSERRVISLEYILLIIFVFLLEYLVNIVGFPVAFIALVIYLTVFKLNHFYMNMYCVIALVQVIVSNMTKVEDRVIVYGVLTCVNAFCAFVWKRIKQ